MTRKHLATSKTSTRAIPKRQERSRRTDISILLVLREKEVRYCLREGQPAVCHQCVEVYQTVRRGQPHESTKARVRRATTSSRYTVSSIPKPHAVVVVVVVVVLVVAVVVVAVVVVVVVVVAAVVVVVVTVIAVVLVLALVLLVVLVLVLALVLVAAAASSAGAVLVLIGRQLCRRNRHLCRTKLQRFPLLRMLSITE